MNMEFTLNGTGFTEEIVCLFTRSVKSKTNILIKLLLTRVTFIHNVLYRNYQSQLNVVILVPDLIWTFTSRILLVLPRNGAFLPISSPTQPLTHKCTDSLCFFSNANRHFNTCFVPNRFSKTPAVIDVSKCKSVGAG